MTISRPARNRARQEWIDALLVAFENVIHVDGKDFRWYSRNPETLQWEDDRAPGRRLVMIRRMAEQEYARSDELSPAERELARQLHSLQNQYGILRELDWVLRRRPEPHDFRTNRAR